MPKVIKIKQEFFDKLSNKLEYLFPKLNQDNTEKPSGNHRGEALVLVAEADVLLENLIEDLLESIKLEKENTKGVSKYEDTEIEGMYDWICSQIGFSKGTEELRSGIRLFGQKRFNQAVRELEAKIKKELED